MNLLSGHAYRSSKVSEWGTYSSVAQEYYDEVLHPTCADFRLASWIYLERLFEEVKPTGRMADIGCGKSLIAEFCQRNLVLIDQSIEMLEHNAPLLERRLMDVERESIGRSEFDWIFAVLADPYNTPEAWKNIGRALKSRGQCIFIVPSFEWVGSFRRDSMSEKPNLARFITARGDEVFLRSLVFDLEFQKEMIAQAGLVSQPVEHVLVRDLPFVKSRKISEVLSRDQALLDVYRVSKREFP